MTRKQYEKPSMKVVLLQQRTMLLAGSNGGGGDIPGNAPYTPGDNPFGF